MLKPVQLRDGGHCTLVQILNRALKKSRFLFFVLSVLASLVHAHQKSGESLYRDKRSTDLEIKGGLWAERMFFSDNPREKHITEIRQHSSIGIPFYIAGSDEQVDEVHIFKNNLFLWFPARFYVWHEFVIVKSANWYWSFEKNTKGILVQRARDFDSVRSFCHGAKRRGIVQSTGQPVQKGHPDDTIDDILDWIHRKGYLNRRYHLLRSNCQVFALELYKTVSHHDGRHLGNSLFYIERPGFTPRNYTLLLEIAAQEKITQVWVITQTRQADEYISPEIEKWLLPRGVDEREFAIIESNNVNTHLSSYWSFEKLTDGIALQHDENFDTLVKESRGMKRPGSIMIKNEQNVETLYTEDTVKDIFYWISAHLSHRGALIYWKKNPDRFGSLLYSRIMNYANFHYTFDDHSDEVMKFSKEYEYCLRDGYGERILQVEMYKYPVSAVYSSTTSSFESSSPKWHVFMVIKSTNLYWSFEKLDKGISVQSGKNETKIKLQGRDRYNGLIILEERHSISLEDTEKDITDIVNWIHKEKYLDARINWKNCTSHQFASKLYEEIVRYQARDYDVEEKESEYENDTSDSFSTIALKEGGGFVTIRFRASRHSPQIVSS